MINREKQTALEFLNDCTKLQIRELVENNYENTEVFMEGLRSILSNRDVIRRVIESYV